jgi:hypothetical protein
LNNFHLFWEHSILWLLPAFVLSLGISWIAYSRSNDFPKGIRWLLFGIRSFLLFLVFALLLNPLLRRFKETSLPPVSVILVDNSASVSLGTSPDSLAQFQAKLKELATTLEKSGSQVHFAGLNGSLEKDSALRFNVGSTDVESSLRKIQEEFENQNLAQIILASDGIVNKGSDLSQSTFPFKINTIKLGNPVTRKDVLISEVRINKVAFLGNTFPISALVKAKKTGSIPLNVSLFEGGKLVETKSVTPGANGLANVDFSIRPTSKGIKQFKMVVSPVDGEVTLANNSRTFFIEVIDGKQKVLLLASAPHPDIKAIRSALEPIDQIELTTIIGGLDSYKPDAWNLVILHQLPERGGVFGPQVSSFLKGNTSLLLITGLQTDFSRLRNESSAWLNIQGFGNGSDEVNGAWEDGFQRFIFEDKWKKTFSDLPPLRSPTLSYSWKSASETILTQKLGRVISPTPLLSVQLDGAVKRGIFWGDGLWLWRLNEFARNENTDAVDNLISKTVQLLLSAEKKKRLRVFLTQSEFLESDEATFGIETYNQLFEPIYDQKVDVVLSQSGGPKSNYRFVNGKGISTFRTQSLPVGAYHFKATASLNGKLETEEGDFVVRPNDLEARDLEANHGLLDNLATSNGGKSVGISGISALGNVSDLPKPMIEFTDWDENLLSFWWILVVFIGLLTTEWALRKWNGTL